jgi:hypothetical protein
MADALRAGAAPGDMGAPGAAALILPTGGRAPRGAPRPTKVSL